MDLGRRGNDRFNDDTKVLGLPMIRFGLVGVWDGICLEFLVIGHGMETGMVWLDVTTGNMGAWKAIRTKVSVLRGVN